VIGLTVVLNIGKILALNKLIGKIRFYEFEPAAFRRKIKKIRRFAKKQVFYVPNVAVADLSENITKAGLRAVGLANLEKSEGENYGSEGENYEKEGENYEKKGENYEKEGIYIS